MIIKLALSRKACFCPLPNIRIKLLHFFLCYRHRVYHHKAALSLRVKISNMGDNEPGITKTLLLRLLNLVTIVRTIRVNDLVPCFILFKFTLLMLVASWLRQ